MLFNIYSIFSDLNFLITLLLLIFILIPYTVLIFITIWVYKDAKKKRINAAVWVVIVWITPFFIGFIRYLIFRKKHVSNI
jgi:hypothetical protein